MARKASTDVLRNSRDVGVSVPRAFEVFTVGLSTWWIPEFTWSGPDALDLIGIEPGVDGKCYEIGPYGFRCDWGRVTVWEPPNRLAFTWQIGPDRVPQPDPAKASEVEVLFHSEGEARTRVELEHRGFERHGEGGAGYREALEAGWDQLLARYAAAVG